MSRATERQRAAALQAADARTLIQVALPFALQHMTAAQVDRVQRVLDANVVNPAVAKDVLALERQAIIAQSGRLANLDPKLLARADQARLNYIPVTAADQSVRLDYAKLLTPDALAPTTDNPDERAFLHKVAYALKDKGVWLRFDQKISKDANGNQVIDARTFHAWLSFGSDGDAIPAERGGRLTRSALLGTRTLGAGYYRQVFQGNVASVLTNALKRVENQIENGALEHSLLAKDRRTIGYGLVAGAADVLGGANYPEESIWKEPRKILVRALELNSDSNVKKSSQAAIIAALSTGIAAQQLAAYLDATYKGAGRAVKVLTVVKTVAKIAEVVLVVHTVAVGLTRLLAVEATEIGTAAVTRVIPRTPNHSPAAFYDTNYPGRAAWGKTLQQAETSLSEVGGVASQRGAAGAGVTRAETALSHVESMALNRYQLANEQLRSKLMQELEVFLRANPNAPLEAKLAALDRVNRLAGYPW